MTLCSLFFNNILPLQEILMDYLDRYDDASALLRVLRAFRIVKLVPKARGLKLMLTTLMWSLPALFNVAMVLLLFMYIYVSPHVCK